MKLVNGKLVKESNSDLDQQTIDYDNHLISIRYKKLAEILKGYSDEIVSDIEFTTEGNVVKTYQADTISQSRILGAVTVYGLYNEVPSGFTWRSKDNTNVLFTINDLKGLAKAIVDRSTGSLYIKLQSKKSSVLSTININDLKTITWEN